MFTKQTLWIAIIVSMVIGGFVGVAIDRYGFQNNDSHFGKTRFVNYVSKRLDLTSSQRRQLDSLINYVHPKFQAIRKKFNADLQDQMDSTKKMITEILTTEQQHEFQVVLNQMKKNSDNH